MNEILFGNDTTDRTNEGGGDNLRLSRNRIPETKSSSSFLGYEVDTQFPEAMFFDICYFELSIHITQRLAEI